MTLSRNQSVPRLLGQQVDGGRIAARVDRPAHQRHGGRHEAVAARLHERRRGKHRNRRLADRHDMRVRPERMEDVDEVVDIVVEVERAFADRHHARIGPVGDVDFGMRQHRLDRAAQQRRIVAGHRRHDQQLAVGLAAGRQRALEMDQVAERPPPDASFRSPPRSSSRPWWLRYRSAACHSGAWCARTARPSPPRSGPSACAKTD